MKEWKYGIIDNTSRFRMKFCIIYFILGFFRPLLKVVCGSKVKNPLQILKIWFPIGRILPVFAQLGYPPNYSRTATYVNKYPQQKGIRIVISIIEVNIVGRDRQSVEID
jgi:hypothetical protein